MDVCPVAQIKAADCRDQVRKNSDNLCHLAVQKVGNGIHTGMAVNGNAHTCTDHRAVNQSIAAQLLNPGQADTEELAAEHIKYHCQSDEHEQGSDQYLFHQSEAVVDFSECFHIRLTSKD